MLTEKISDFYGLIFPVTLPLKTTTIFVSTVHGENLFINDVVLPVGLKIRTDRELVTTENSVSKNKAEEIAKADCILYEIFTKNKSKVISKQISVKENKDGYRVITDYIFNENIADQVDFDVTE